VNLKIALLIALIIFATVTTSFALGISVKQTYQSSENFKEFQDFVQLCNGTEVEPNRPIDTPGGPT